MNTITLNREKITGMKFDTIIKTFSPDDFKNGHIDSLCATPSRTTLDIKHPVEDRLFEIIIERS